MSVQLKWINFDIFGAKLLLKCQSCYKKGVNWSNTIEFALKTILCLCIKSQTVMFKSLELFLKILIAHFCWELKVLVHQKILFFKEHVWYVESKNIWKEKTGPGVPHILVHFEARDLILSVLWSHTKVYEITPLRLWKHSFLQYCTFSGISAEIVSVTLMKILSLKAYSL